MIFIDLHLLLLMLIPPKDRLPWFIDLGHALIAPLVELQQEVQGFFEHIKYDLQFNGQVIYMEHLLNDKFDPDNRQIYIEDSTSLDQVFFFNANETNEPVYLTNTSEAIDGVYLHNNSEVAAEFDFVVFIPSSVVFDLEILSYYVNKYRVAPMRWKVEIV